MAENQQNVQLASTKSFIRNLRGGSTKNSHRDLNSEQPPIAPPVVPTNDAYSSIRSSHSVQLVSNDAAINPNNNNNNMSSFTSTKFRSSSTIHKSASIKNSPIPPPRVTAIDQPQNKPDLDDSKPFSTNIQGSPLLSTFRHSEIENRRGTFYIDQLKYFLFFLLNLISYHKT